MSSLLPEGVTSLRDLPWTLHRAIAMALSFLRMEDNLPEDEQAPRAIWFNVDRMEEHWEAVKRRREEKWGKQDNDDGEKDMRRNAYLDEFYVK